MIHDYYLTWENDWKHNFGLLDQDFPHNWQLEWKGFSHQDGWVHFTKHEPTFVGEDLVENDSCGVKEFRPMVMGDQGMGNKGYGLEEPQRKMM